MRWVSKIPPFRELEVSNLGVLRQRALARMKSKNWEW